MKRYLVLLPMLLLGTVTFAAPGLKPGGLAEFNAELPRELRLVAGRGQLSPVAHALVTIAAPANLDTTRDWVRRDKAALSSGCESHPANAPAGSIGAVMEVTKWLEPSGKRATIRWSRECAGRNASER